MTAGCRPRDARPRKTAFLRATLMLALLAPVMARAQARPVIEKEVIPHELSVKVYALELASGLGAVPVWIYVSRGLARKKQKEVVIGVKREAGDKASPPTDVFELFRTLDDAATQIGTVDVGDLTQFEPGVAILGDPQLRCVVYLPRPHLPEAEVPDGTILGLIVPCAESDAAMHFGSVRFMMRMALATQYMPTPPWTDRNRRELQAANDGSILAGSPTHRVRGLGVVLERQRGSISLRLGRDASDTLRKLAADRRPNEPLMLLPCSIRPQTRASSGGQARGSSIWSRSLRRTPACVGVSTSWHWPRALGRTSCALSRTGSSSH
jgi:hypothetical protein